MDDHYVPMPTQLPDANNDGYADQNDFYHAFAKTSQTPSQIYDLFQTADVDHNAKVDQKEWSDFYDLFVKDFTERCDRNEDNKLSETEFEECIEELPTVDSVMKTLKINWTLDIDLVWEELVAILSTRVREMDEVGLAEHLKINLAEYMYFRRAALAWKDCVSVNKYITKTEVKGCAFVIMLPFQQVNDNDLNYVWDIGMDLLPREFLGGQGKLGFLGFLTLFRKYDQFKHYDYNLLRDGTLGYNTFIKGIDDGDIPIDRMNKQIVEKLFDHYAEDKWKTSNDTIREKGIDFKAYFILSSLTDAITMFGKASPGTVNIKEFMAMLESNFVPYGVLQTIDQVQLQFVDEVYQSIFNTIQGEQEEDDIEDLERKLMNPTASKYLGSQPEFIQKSFRMKKLRKHKHQIRLNKKQVAGKNQAIYITEKNEPGVECEECRERFFNIYAIQKNIHYHELFGEVEYALDYVDLYNMWKHVYLFNSCDIDHIGKFYPTVDKNHIDWVIPPSQLELELYNKVLIDLENHPINVIIFIIQFRYQRVFRKIAENQNKNEKVINREDLEEGLEALNLPLYDQEYNKCLEPMSDQIIPAINRVKTFEEEENIDPMIPYNWQKCFNIAVLSFSNRIEKYFRSHLSTERKLKLRQNKLKVQRRKK